MRKLQYVFDEMRKDFKEAYNEYAVCVFRFIACGVIIFTGTTGTAYLFSNILGLSNGAAFAATTFSALLVILLTIWTMFALIRAETRIEEENAEIDNSPSNTSRYNK